LPVNTDEIQGEAAQWFFATSDDIFVVLKDSLILQVNPTWTRLTGWSAAEITGRNITDLIHPLDRPVVDEAIQTLIAQRQAECEHRIACKAGGWVWVRARSKLQPNDVAMLVLQDITDVRQRERDAAEAARTRDILREEAGVFIWRFDPSTGEYAVDSDLSRAGAPGASGHRILTVAEMVSEIHPDDQQRMTEAFLTSVSSGESSVIEYRHFRAEDHGWASVRAAWRGTRKLASGAWEILGITQDVSALADARDAALQAAEVKAQFLANMSHEIRTPMNGMLGVLHLLRKEPLSADGRRLLDEALGCGAMLSELLNDVIDFSRLEAGKIELSVEPVQPARLLDSVIALLRPQAEAKGLTLTVDALDDRWVEIDPVRVRQILFNLIGNAVKFTPRGGVTARMSLEGSGADARLGFDIIDSGIGIELDEQASLFDRFQQADGSATRRFGGAGLGLSIARGLAEQMGGTIAVVSTPGEGSTFRVEIAAPICAAPGEVAAEEDDSLPLDGLKVLVVEDNPTNRTIVTRMLEQLGVVTTVAHDGREGLEAAQAQAFDLILMDIQMPRMDGVAATTAIRALATPSAGTPIIAMTANAMSHQIDSYLSAGMNAWVSKPISPAVLLQTIVQALAQSWIEDSVAPPGAL
jgi:two-component system, sensor histidine kinase